MMKKTENDTIDRLITEANPTVDPLSPKRARAIFEEAMTKSQLVTPATERPTVLSTLRRFFAPQTVLATGTFAAVACVAAFGLMLKQDGALNDVSIERIHPQKTAIVQPVQEKKDGTKEVKPTLVAPPKETKPVIAHTPRRKSRHHHSSKQPSMMAQAASAPKPDETLPLPVKEEEPILLMDVKNAPEEAPELVFEVTENAPKDLPGRAEAAGLRQLPPDALQGAAGPAGTPGVEGEPATDAPILVWAHVTVATGETPTVNLITVKP